MLTISNISVSGNTMVVAFSGKDIYFHICGSDEIDIEAAKQQMVTAFAICPTFDDICHHMNINGFDVDLEDIVENNE